MTAAGGDRLCAAQMARQILGFHWHLALSRSLRRGARHYPARPRSRWLNRHAGDIRGYRSRRGGPRRPTAFSGESRPSLAPMDVKGRVASTAC